MTAADGGDDVDDATLAVIDTPHLGAHLTLLEERKRRFDASREDVFGSGGILLSLVVTP